MMRWLVSLGLLLSVAPGRLLAQGPAELLVSVPDDARVVKYLPALIQFVDRSNRPQTTLECIEASSVVVVSGFVSLTIKQADLDLLTKRAREKYWPEIRVEPIVISSVEVKIQGDGSIMEHLGPFSWPSSPLSLQFDVPGALRTRKVLLEARLHWTESVTAHATITVDWNKLKAKENYVNEATESDVVDAISEALVDGAIVVHTTQSKSGTIGQSELWAKARTMLLEQFEASYLVRVSESTQESVRFTVRSTNEEVATADFEVSAIHDVPREYVVSREVKLCR
jgi:hypothetical protein